MTYVMDVFMADTSSLKNRALVFAFATTPYIGSDSFTLLSPSETYPLNLEVLLPHPGREFFLDLLSEG
jgi:hypothetical protein